MSRYHGYRTELTRLSEWDYRRSTWYFIVICTKGRACFFGTVRRGVMGLSRVGCVAHRFWANIPEVRIGADHHPVVQIGGDTMGTAKRLPGLRMAATVLRPRHMQPAIAATQPAAHGRRSNPLASRPQSSESLPLNALA